MGLREVGLHVTTSTPPWPTSFDPAAAHEWEWLAQQIDKKINHEDSGVELGARALGLHVRAASSRVYAAWGAYSGW